MRFGYGNRIPPAIGDRLDEMAAAAQSVYDGWEQIDGMDEELGGGGICDRIASRFGDILAEAGMETALVHASVGENHVFVVALVPDAGIYSVDIPPGVYETGAGYVWTKKPGVLIGAEDIMVDRLSDPISAEDFAAAYSE